MPAQEDPTSSAVSGRRCYLQFHVTCAVMCLAGERKLVVTDSLFSMNGDWADLRGLANLRRRHGFLLAIDEAHASLVVGPRLTCSFGKAAVAGHASSAILGFAANKRTRRTLINSMEPGSPNKPVSSWLLHRVAKLRNLNSLLLQLHTLNPAVVPQPAKPAVACGWAEAQAVSYQVDSPTRGFKVSRHQIRQKHGSWITKPAKP